MDNTGTGFGRESATRRAFSIINQEYFDRTWVAACFCLLLSCVHTAVSVVLVVPGEGGRLVDRWQQLAANILVLLAANLVGLFIHNLTEEGQRRAFLDTRDCIAARLEMEDENEKLVSNND
jgi:hypothetical protein